MATTVVRSLFAALAAVFIGLSGCGGGEEPSQTTVSAPPFTGVQTTEGRKKALASSVQQPSGFSVSLRVLVGGGNATPQQNIQAAVAAENAISAEDLLAWAELTYPEYFPGHAATLQGEYLGWTYTFRRYAVPGGYNFAAVRSDNTVWGLGPYVGSNERPYLFGNLANFQCPINPTSCSPKVLSVSPKSGSVNVSVRNTPVVFTFNEALNCANIGGTTEVGDDVKLIVTVACNSAAKTVTVTPAEDRWLFGSTSILTIGGVPNLAGYPSAQVSVTFTTRSAATEQTVYVGNATPGLLGEQSAAAISLRSGTVTQISLDGSRQGFGDARRVVVDPLTGTVWYGMLGTVYLYRTDMETNRELAPVPLDFETMHALSGLALTESSLCVTFGRTGSAGYSRQNQLECRSRTTMQPVFKSSAGYLADASTMMTIGLKYLPFGTEKKLYALSADKASHFGEVWDNSGGIREGYEPGMKGEVTEIDATTYQVTNRFRVGSVPQGIDRDPVTGDLYVVNSGDRSLSVIARNGQVTTVSFAVTFTGMQRPMRIKVDQPRGRFYVTDYLGSLVVFDLTTRREVTRLPVGVLPVDLTMSADSLYVVAMGGTVTEIALDTQTVRRTFSGLGANSYAVDLYRP